jgi:hypothetical protein
MHDVGRFLRRNILDAGENLPDLPAVAPRADARVPETTAIFI